MGRRRGRGEEEGERVRRRGEGEHILYTHKPECEALETPFMPLQQLPFKRDEGLRKGALPPLAHTQAWSGPGWVCVYPNLKILYPRAAVKYPPLSHPRAYHKLTPLMLSPSRALPSHI